MTGEKSPGTYWTGFKWVCLRGCGISYRPGSTRGRGGAIWNIDLLWFAFERNITNQIVTLAISACEN